MLPSLLNIWTLIHFKGLIMYLHLTRFCPVVWWQDMNMDLLILYDNVVLLGSNSAWNSAEFEESMFLRTLVSTYKSTRRYNLKHQHRHIHRREITSLSYFIIYPVDGTDYFISFWNANTCLYNKDWLLIDYGGVRLCLRTVATNGSIVHLPGGMWARSAIVIMPAGDNSWLVHQSSVAVLPAETCGVSRRNGQRSDNLPISIWNTSRDL
jgi:hypothetical protein